VVVVRIPEITGQWLSPARHGGEVGFSVRARRGPLEGAEPGVRAGMLSCVPSRRWRLVDGNHDHFREQQGCARTVISGRELEDLFLKRVDCGFGIGFLRELQSRMHGQLDSGGGGDVPPDRLRDQVGIHRQRQTDLKTSERLYCADGSTGDQLPRPAELRPSAMGRGVRCGRP